MAKKRVARKRPGRARAAAAKKAPGIRGKPVAKRGTGKKPVAKRGTRKKAKAAKKTVAKRSTKRATASKRATAAGGLLTLTEVSKQTGISMPTLQRYKKLYQSRLQTVGKGRTQRYQPESLETFRQIKQENLKKRGRPRKSASAVQVKAKPPAAKAAGAAPPSGLISLSEIGRRTGISYPTLLRYVKVHGSRIPSHGTGRKRRFPAEAVAVFQQLRQESRRGRRKGGGAKKPRSAGRGMDARLRQLEKSHKKLETQLKRVMKALSKPLVKG